MAKTTDTRQDSGAADASADLGRIAVDMLRNAPVMPIHPLMAHPAAAFAAAAAIGFGFTSQIAGAFFGALQGVVEATSKRAVAPVEKSDAIAEEKPVARKAGAGEAKPIKVSSTARSAAAKPAVVKKAEPKKPAAVKAAPAKAKVVAAPPVAIAAKPAAAPVRSRKAAVKADDLKRISGVGPKLEQILNGLGILRFADIAAWSDADIERIDAELGFEGRIRRDDCVGQAKALQPKGRA